MYHVTISYLIFMYNIHIYNKMYIVLFNISVLYIIGKKKSVMSCQNLFIFKRFQFQVLFTAKHL